MFRSISWNFEGRCFIEFSSDRFVGSAGLPLFRLVAECVARGLCVQRAPNASWGLDHTAQLRTTTEGAQHMVSLFAQTLPFVVCTAVYCTTSTAGSGERPRHTDRGRSQVSLIFPLCPSKLPRSPDHISYLLYWAQKRFAKGLRTTLDIMPEPLAVWRRPSRPRPWLQPEAMWDSSHAAIEAE